MTIVSSNLSHGNVEGCLCLPQPRRHVHTVDIRVESLAEHHAVERSVKLYTDLKRKKIKSRIAMLLPMHISSCTIGV